MTELLQHLPQIHEGTMSNMSGPFRPTRSESDSIFSPYYLMFIDETRINDAWRKRQAFLGDPVFNIGMRGSLALHLSPLPHI